MHVQKTKTHPGRILTHTPSTGSDEDRHKNTFQECWDQTDVHAPSDDAAIKFTESLNLWMRNSLRKLQKQTFKFENILSDTAVLIITKTLFIYFGLI